MNVNYGDVSYNLSDLALMIRHSVLCLFFLDFGWTSLIGDFSKYPNITLVDT